MRKFTLSLLTLILLLPALHGQTFWVNNEGGSTIDEALDVATDNSGNTYVTGYFTSTVNFSGTSMASQGLGDVFVAKYNPNGQLVWVTRAGSGNEERGTAIAVDASGNVFIGGYFYGTSQFGLTSLTSSGAQDIFIAKLNSAGTFQWAIGDGGNGADILNGIATDNNGNVVATGEFTGTATFGSTTLNGQGVDIFTIKYDGTGNFSWAKMGTASATDRGLSVATDATGNIYITGQFSNNITFDNTYTNNIINAAFLVKYNASGTEQWFRKIGGGTYNISNDVATDALGFVYITGDFGGSLIFFPNIGSPLTNPYPKCIFIAKYNSNGDFQWAEADGSNNNVTSKSIAVHNGNGGHLFVGGEFECKFNEYSDNYGQGVFLGVGLTDIFVSKYSLSGSWNFSQQAASQQADKLRGIAMASDGNVVLAGGMEIELFIPSNYNFTFPYSDGLDLPMTTSNTYCNSSNFYHYYRRLNSYGNYDAFMGKMIDPTRAPYDFWYRNGNGCNRVVNPGCIGPSQFSTFCFGDTVSFCQQGNLSGNPQTFGNGYGASPNFNYLWSNGSTSSSISVNTPGYYSVTMTSTDGCIVIQDTIYVDINPPPSATVSDSKQVNNHSPSPNPIILCLPDSVTITGHPVNAVDWFWLGPGLGVLHDTVFTTSQSGFYQFYAISAENCTTQVTIQVIANNGIIPAPGFQAVFPQDLDLNDTITLCQNIALQYQIFTSPPTTFPPCNGTLMATGTISPTNASIFAQTPCYAGQSISGSAAHPVVGWYVFNFTIQQFNNCDTALYTLVDSIYINNLPVPVVTMTLQGPTSICPGDTLTLTGTGPCNTPQWSGGNIIPTVNPYVVQVTSPGYYTINCIVTDTNGCSSSGAAYHQVTNATQPVVSLFPSNGIICPGDSVAITTNAPGVSFHWFTPNGDFIATNNTIYGNTGGTYYCAVTYATGCVLVSNSVNLVDYTTPFLLATPDAISCNPNDPVTLQVQAPQGSVIQWLPPLSGNNPQYVIYVPGTYICSITACNVTTYDTVTVQSAADTAHISVAGNFDFCLDSVITLVATSDMNNYQWQPGNLTNDTITVTASGSFTVTATDSLGCTSTSQPFNVNINPNILTPPVITISGPSEFCEGDTVSLTCSGCINSPVWTGSPIPTSSPDSVLVMNGGTYVSECIITENGCTVSGSDTLVVVMHPEPVLSVSPQDGLICPGDSVLLSVTGGGNFNWTTPFGPFFTDTNYLYTDIPGLYTCSVVDPYGCFFLMDSATLIQYQTPTLSLTPDMLICDPSDSAVIELTVTPGTNFQWAPPLSGNNTQQIVHQAGTYSCSATLCNITTNLSVFIQGPVALANISANADSSFCEGDSLILTATGGMSSYVWTPGNSTSTSITVHTAGNYVLTVTDSLGCTASDTYQAYVYPNTIDPPNAKDILFCPAEYITYSAAGDGMIYWYDSPNATTPLDSGENYFAGLLNAPDTIYALHVYDGCVSEFSAIMAIPGPCDSIDMPTVFTPNGDGYNDWVDYFIMGTTCFSIEIYNRWGTVIFRTGNPAEPWHGTTMQGEKCSDGVYWYILDYCPKDKPPQQLVGFIHLFN